MNLPGLKGVLEKFNLMATLRLSQFASLLSLALNKLGNTNTALLLPPFKT